MVDDAQELVARQRSLLVEQRLRNGDLADVVQQAGDAHALGGLVAEAEVEGEGAGEIADALRVAARVAGPSLPAPAPARRSRCASARDRRGSP